MKWIGDEFIWNEDDLTPWFDADMRPAYPGMYIRHTPYDRAGWGYWDGRHWHITAPQYAVAMHTSITGCQNLKWRALNRNPMHCR